MRLHDAPAGTLTSVVYRRARSGGGSETAVLPVQRVAASGLPAGCAAVLVTGDLQGVASPPHGGDPVLLGIALAGYLGVWAEAGLIPPPASVGVLLAGDLFSAPAADVRGASGDVTAVWRAFDAAGCAFVAGVAGNHDVVDPSLGSGALGLGSLGSGPLASGPFASGPFASGSLMPGPLVLDGAAVTIGGVRIGGIGGVVGDAGRFSAALDGVGPCDVLVLHEGPDGGDDRRGNPTIRQLLSRRPPALTVCGHVHWADPIAPLGPGRVLNVDGRAVLLQRR